MWSKEKVVVTGASGFLGSHLTRRLLHAGSEVLAIGRHADRLAQFEGECRTAICSICNREELAGTIRDFRPSVIYHMAAHPDGVESADQVRNSLNTNTLGVLNTLEAAIAAQARVFVMADSVKVYGNPGENATSDLRPFPICSYAIAKAASWQVAKVMSAISGLQVVGLRLTFIYGPRQNWNLISYVQRCVERDEPVRLQGGNQTRDLLFVDDAVNAFLAAAQRRVAYGHTIPVGGGHEISINEICCETLRVLGSSLPVLENAQPARMTEIWRSSSENSDAARLLRWAPRVSLREGLLRTLRPSAALASEVARA
jgi:nucleoside-diphosphate-sugar epimerase